MKSKKQLTTSITAELHAELCRKAQEKELSVSDITRMALREFLERSKIAEKEEVRAE